MALKFTALLLAGAAIPVEVAPGEQFGSEFLGKPQVANVVLAAGAGLSATLEAGLRRSFNNRYFPEASGWVVLKRGASSFTLAGALQQYGFPEIGYDRLIGLPGGNEALWFDRRYVGTRPLHRPDAQFFGNSLSFWTADFRQDLGKFAWGLHLEAGSTSTNYRRDERDSFYGMQPFASMFAEYRPTKSTTLTIGARNALDLPAYRYRTFFSPSRATLTPVAFEERQRNQHIIPYVTVKHSFG